MTLDIRHVLENGHYHRVVAFAKRIGLYEPKKPEPHPDTCRYWQSKGDDRRMLKVLEPATPEGRACFMDLRADSMSLHGTPFWMRVEDLHAEYTPTNWHVDGPMRFLHNAFEYLDGYGQDLSDETGNDPVLSYDYTRTTLYVDRAPASFYFVVERKQVYLGSDQRYHWNGEWSRWFDGGLVYHGPPDGWGEGAHVPTSSVTLEPTHGWSIYT